MIQLMTTGKHDCFPHGSFTKLPIPHQHNDPGVASPDAQSESSSTTDSGSVPQRTVHRFKNSCARGRDCRQRIAFLPDLRAQPRWQNPKILQDRIQADRSVSLARDHPVPFRRLRLLQGKTEKTAIAENTQEFHAGQRGRNPDFRKPSMQTESPLPYGAALFRQNPDPVLRHFRTDCS